MTRPGDPRDPLTVPDPRLSSERRPRMSAFEKAAAIERDKQWGEMTPGVEPWPDQRKADAMFMAGYDRRGLLNELGWREPFLDPDHYCPGCVFCRPDPRMPREGADR